MAQRSRKIFTIFLLVVLCIATVAMPFAYAAEVPTDGSRMCYAVLPYDFIEVIYADGHMETYPFPSVLPYENEDRSYVRIELSDSYSGASAYDLVLSYTMIPDYGNLPDGCALLGFSLSSSSGSLVGATVTFNLDEVFVSSAFFYYNCKIQTLNSVFYSPGLISEFSLSNYKVLFSTLYFDPSINQLQAYHSSRLTYDHIVYPAVDGQPSLGSIPFAPVVNPITNPDVLSAVDAGGGFLVSGGVVVTLDDGYLGWRAVYVGPSAYSSYMNTPAFYINDLTLKPFPNPGEFSGWISDATMGFLDLEIVPGLSLWMIFAAVVTIPLVIMFLKIFAGG